MVATQLCTGDAALGLTLPHDVDAALKQVSANNPSDVDEEILDITPISSFSESGMVVSKEEVSVLPVYCQCTASVLSASVLSANKRSAQHHSQMVVKTDSD